MYEMLKHAHSGIRWLLLIALILAVANAFMKWRSAKPYTNGDKKLNMFTMIFAHVQLLLGLGVYFVSPKVNLSNLDMSNSIQRFFAVEHAVMMLIAVILITLGHIRSKKAAADSGGSQFKTAFTFFLIALLLILYAIPWPFQNYGAAWF